MQADRRQLGKELDGPNLLGLFLAVVFMLPTIYCGLMAVNSSAIVASRPIAQFGLGWSLSGLAAWTAASTAARHHCWRIASIAIAMGIVAIVVIGIGS